MWTYFNIEKRKSCCSRKRKMRVLSLTQEQRGYYHATASLIYPVCYVARIPSVQYFFHQVGRSRNILSVYTKIFVKRVFEFFFFFLICYALFN